MATNHTALNVQTDSLAAGQTAYNPYASGAPLTIYAAGTRNAYDLIWDTNGHLYAATNGAAAGGNIPATPPGVTPAAPAINGVGVAEDDYVYDIQPGGYYGHPDPARGQYIFGGGNPNNPAPNTAIQGSYPLGTNPDPNYRGYAYDFGVHYSPDGDIEYTGNAFGGALNGALLITEYSGGKDIIALRTGSNGQITQAETGIAGFTGFQDPVDVIEDTRNGDLYVADLGTSSIMLLRPIASGATIAVSAGTLQFNAPVNGAASAVQTLIITNTGSQPLAIPATGMSVIGADGALFPLAAKPLLPTLIAPGASIAVGIVFNPGNGAVGLHTGTLQISSNDQVNPLISINLRGLTTAGLGGSNEPSLQSILDLYQIPDNVGTANPAQSYFTDPPQTPNDQVQMPQLQKAGSGPVTVSALASFDAGISPAVGFGIYTSGFSDSRAQLFSISSNDSQSVAPSISGTTSFDPGSSVFGIYASFDAFINSATGTARVAYSEAAFNSFDPADGQDIRFYPLKNPDGSVVANAFVFAIDDGGALPNYQFNNLVGIIRNVQAVSAAPVIGVQNVAGNDTESAPSPLRFVFNATTHNTDDIRIVSTGSAPVVISSITSSNAVFSLPAGLSYPLSIAPGSSFDLNVSYNPAHGGSTMTDSGALTINSNAPTQLALSLQLDGIPPGSSKPTLPQIVSAFGFSALGSETASAYWTRSDANLPVTVQELAAFSGRSAGSSLYWYAQGHSTTFNAIVGIPGTDTSGLLPLSNDSGKTPAIGTFSASGVFGFSVDKTEFSDDTLNTHGSSNDTGHHVMFYQLYDSIGNPVPHTWLMVMSYSSSTEPFTYTDNVYLIRNLRPAPPSAPTGATATGSISGNTFSWNAVKSPLVSGYLVYRSTSSSTGFVRVGPSVVTGTSFLDTTATPGVKYYYTVAALDTQGSISSFTGSVSATRTTDTTAPPKLTVSENTSKPGVNLVWNTSPVTDLAGYNVYRGSSQTGPFFKMTPTPLTTTSYTDTECAEWRESLVRSDRFEPVWIRIRAGTDRCASRAWMITGLAYVSILL